MSGKHLETESDPPYSSHQFRNPIDEDLIEVYGLRENSSNNGLNFSRSRRNPIDDYEMTSRQSSGRYPFHEQNEILVDFDEPPTDYGRDRSQSWKRHEDMFVGLLQRRIEGLVFEKTKGMYSYVKDIELMPGMMFRTMAEDDWKMDELREWSRTHRREGMVAPMEDLSCDPTMCSMFTSADLMRVTHEQAIHLLSVNAADRLTLYQDFERFNFILNLQIGDSVLVEVEKEKVPAKIMWCGERTQNSTGGVWYKVDFDSNVSSSQAKWPPNSRSPHEQLSRHFENNWNIDMNGGSSSVRAPSSASSSADSSRPYYSPGHLYMPVKGGGVPALYDNGKPLKFNHGDEYYRGAPGPKPAPRERNVPIQRHQPVPTPSVPHSTTFDRQSRSMHQQPPPPPQPPLNVSFAPTLGHVQPSRSKSVHSIPTNHLKQQTADRNESVDSDQIPFRIGDPCLWVNKGIEEMGTVRFIGFLKGHKTLYAGVEFRNKIGAGTGVFNKEQLFRAQEGHAGFVEVSALESPRPVISSLPSTSSASTSSSAHHRRRLSSSRSQQMNAVVATGTSISVPVSGSSFRHPQNHQPNGKQASVESLSDPPPPPYTPPSPPRSSSAAATHQQLPPPIPPKPIAHVEDYLIDSYDIGNHVIVTHLGAQRNGYVRWLGDEMNDEGEEIVRSAVVQLTEDVPPWWRRSQDARLYAGSPVHGGVIVPVTALRHNRGSRNGNGSLVPSSTSSSAYNNYTSSSNGTINRRTEDFGSIDSGIEKTKCYPARDVLQLVGRQKGIQGSCNSCYLDATLYAMFAQTTVFDSLLEKSLKSEKAALFQKILAQEIVFPLRKFHYVRADHVMKLRRLLAELMPHVTGLTSEEKDPEEILAFIFAKIFDADPFIQLIGPNQVKDTQYLVPIVVDDWQGGAATSQHLLERHMRSAQVTFVKPPPVLIMQLPRYGQQKVFDKILPLETIDITPFVAGAVAPCSRCGACSEMFCPTCFLTRRVFYTEIVYCRACFAEEHTKFREIQDHQPRDLFPPGKPVKRPHSHKMALSAVLCIETSHYVAYVRTANNQWVFFDSMADREGLSDGFNVPVTRECTNMSDWLSLQGWNRLKDADETGQIKAMFEKTQLDPLVGRLLSDSYICIYEDTSPSSSSSSTSSNFISTVKNMMA